MTETCTCGWTPYEIWWANAQALDRALRGLPASSAPTLNHDRDCPFSAVESAA